MSSKYVVIFDLVDKAEILYEGEKKIENAVALLLDSGTKTDEQAVRKFKEIEKNLRRRAKEVRLCKILR